MGKHRWIAVAHTAVSALSQTNKEPTPTFKVASIRECAAGVSPAQVRSTPGRLTLNCWSLDRIIDDAYQVFVDGKVNPLNPSFPLMPIEGGPSWMHSVSYSIQAITAGPQSLAMMRSPVMQKLLENRFRIQVHGETRETSAYMMTVAEGGPKLKPTKDGDCKHLDTTDLTQSLKLPADSKPWCVIASPVTDGSHFVWDVRGMSMEVLSKLMNIDGNHVIDRTGLTGAYNIHLEWDFIPAKATAGEADAASDPGYSSMKSALRKQLGLQLTLGKGPRDFLVIDHLERPSQN